MKCSFWVVRFGHADAKKAHTQDPEKYKGILRETIGHGGPLKIVFRHDGRFIEAKCALPKEELEKTGGRSCNSQNMLNLCNGAVDIHNTITDIQIYGFYIVDAPICQWVYKYTTKSASGQLDLIPAYLRNVACTKGMSLQVYCIKLADWFARMRGNVVGEIE